MTNQIDELMALGRKWASAAARQAMYGVPADDAETAFRKALEAALKPDQTCQEMEQRLKNMRDLLTKREAEHAELRRDAERLDFLGNNPNLALFHYKRRWSLRSPTTNYEYDTFKTVREAIDEAMKS